MPPKTSRGAMRLKKEEPEAAGALLLAAACVPDAHAPAERKREQDPIRDTSVLQSPSFPVLPAPEKEKVEQNAGLQPELQAPVVHLPAPPAQMSEGKNAVSSPSFVPTGIVSATFTCTQEELHPMEILRPNGIYQEFAKRGKRKAEALWWKIFFQGTFAGAYIGFGALLATTVGGAVQGIRDDDNPGIAQWIFGAVFPFGLVLIESTGAELFTGNTAYLVVALVEGKATLRGLLTNWTCTYLGNLVGSMLLSFMIFFADTLSEPASESAMAIAEKKVHLDFGAAVVRGVLCNWLVCLGLWQSAGCKDFASKVLAAWLPVSAFVTCGFEHSVANMFFIPMGIHLGADVTWADMLFFNLVPVTIGNVLGGSVIVALSYSLMFGAPGAALEAWTEPKTKVRLGVGTEEPRRPTELQADSECGASERAKAEHGPAQRQAELTDGLQEACGRAQNNATESLAAAATLASGSHSGSHSASPSPELDKVPADLGAARDFDASGTAVASP